MDKKGIKKMNGLYLLDCTLRDGGYLNDWNFGLETMHTIFKGLVKARISFIEVGFIDDRRPSDHNRSINPTTKDYDEMYGGLDKGQSKIGAMIDFGTCDIKNISPKKDSVLDFIRVIFKKDKKEKALEYVAEIKKLGYIVFAQMVSITSYEERDLYEFAEIANKVKPHAVSVVDTYGLLKRQDLNFYNIALNRVLDSEIAMGYHAHNNFQLAYSNCLTFLDKRNTRDVLVDGTLYGMGKSAGNCPLELLIRTFIVDYHVDYDIRPVLKLIEDVIIPLQQTLKWGYQLDLFVCAAHKVHPNYAAYMRKHGYDIVKIHEVLSKIEGDKKLLYDQSYIEELLK